MLAVAFFVTAIAGGLLGYTLAMMSPPPVPSTYVVLGPVARVHPGVLENGSTAYCDAGNTLVGGGYRIATLFGGDPNETQLEGLQIYRSMPSPSAVIGYEQAWQVLWRSSDLTSPDLTITALAICRR